MVVLKFVEGFDAEVGALLDNLRRDKSCNIAHWRHWNGYWWGCCYWEETGRDVRLADAWRCAARVAAASR